MAGCGCEKEGFETVPLKTDPATNKVVYGYYKVDDDNMAVIPYGYIIDPLDQMKIIPKTNTAAQNKLPTRVPQMPPSGYPLPDGYYKLSDASLAILPPNMLPKVSSVYFTTDTPPQLRINYDVGYVSSSVYYAKKINIDNNNIPYALPAGVYFTKVDKTQVAFLPYGQIADAANGYGMIPNPNLNSNANAQQYRDISNNYNVQFHETAEDLQKKAGDKDINYGEVRVRDQGGNLVILPYVPTQNTATYFKPGEFPFGSSNYVPNYADSIYLSSVSKQYTNAPYANGSKPVEACKAYKELKAQMERYCS
jgi:hypothetical protein